MSEKIRYLVVHEALRDKGFKCFMDAPLDLTLSEAEEWAVQTMRMNELIMKAVEQYLEETK